MCVRFDGAFDPSKYGTFTGWFACGEVGPILRMGAFQRTQIFEGGGRRMERHEKTKLTIFCGFGLSCAFMYAHLCMFKPCGQMQQNLTTMEVANLLMYICLYHKASHIEI